jgi:hypothetical protein
VIPEPVEHRTATEHQIGHPHSSVLLRISQVIGS